MRIVKDKQILSQAVEPSRLEKSKETVRKMKMFLLTNRKAKSAVGLASNQLSLKGRVVALKTNSGNWIFLINPEILDFDGAKYLMKEECLSFPNQSVLVERYSSIRVGCDNIEDAFRLDGFEARILQHEVDHLNGITMLDKELV